MKHAGWFLPSALAATMLLAGCGGDDNDTASTASPSAAGGGETAALVEAPPTTPPADILVEKPLTKTPPTGKRVVWLQCELPTCQRFTPAMEEATKALGWELKTSVFSSANPAKGLQGALDQKPDYIAMSGIPSAAMKPQLAAAEKAGIPVFMSSTPEKAPETPYASSVGGSLEGDAKNIAHWAINDSKGEAHVLGVSIPSFPVLNTETDWLKQNLQSDCSKCSYTSLDLTVEDVGAGAVGSKVVASIQSNPKVNYVLLTFNDLGTGVAEALKSAGLADKVKIVGVAGDSNSFKQVANGANAAWTTAANGWDSYAMVDGMARLSIGEGLDAEYLESVYLRPSWIIDGSAGSQAAIKENGGDWLAPADANEAFTKLWAAGSGR